MRLFRTKSSTERLLDTAKDALGALKEGWRERRLVRAGLVAGGLAGLTAGSAGISSLRRRREEASDDS
jgi:hypothetical protein